VTALVLIAKEPVPGRVKTRLHPPLTLDDAADLAAASIADTVEVVNAVPGVRRVLLFDGVLAPAGTGSWRRVDQADGGLDERLAAVFDLLDEPTLLIGMDTPQVSASQLTAVVDAWGSPDGGAGACFGPASDGGFWALGLREPDGDLLRGVPMSRDDTGAHQLRRLHDAGLRVDLLETLTDVDTIDAAREVAGAAPGTAFAAALARIDPMVGSRS